MGAAGLIVGAHGAFLESAVHALDRAIGPGVVGLREAILNAELLADPLESVHAVDWTVFAKGWRRRRSPPRLGSTAALELDEVDAVIGKHSVDVIRHEGDELVEEVGGDAAGGLRVELGESELGSAVDCDEEVKLAFSCADLGQVEVKEADGIGLELPFAGRGGAWDFRQAADTVALEAAMEGGAGKVWDGGLKRVQTVVERGRRVCRRKVTMMASCSGVSTVERGVGPMGRSSTKERRRHFWMVLGLT